MYYKDTRQDLKWFSFHVDQGYVTINNNTSSIYHQARTL